MTDHNDETPSHPARKHPENVEPGKNVPLRILLVVLILAAGIGVAVFLKKTAPRAHKVAPVKQVQLVRVQRCRSSDEQVKITAFGQVVPVRSVVLKSQVAGEVVSVNPRFDVGALLAAGSEIVRIDPRDYQLEVQRQQAALTRATAALELEMGRQEVARREWLAYQHADNSDTGTDSEAVTAASALALRRPYLHQAQADKAAAQTALRQAQLNLERTTIRTPFDCLVRSKDVDLGAQLNSQARVAEVVASDMFWVEVSVALDKLKWLKLPQVNSTDGSAATIKLQGRHVKRHGKVVKLLGDLAAGSRMARVLVAIDDPLDLKLPPNQRQPLLLGDYVEVNLLGTVLKNVIALPLSALHNGNQLWVAVADKGDGSAILSVRTVHIVWKDRRHAFIDAGLQAGQKVVITDLVSVVDGMAVRVDAQAGSAQ